MTAALECLRDGRDGKQKSTIISKKVWKRDIASFHKLFHTNCVVASAPDDYCPKREAVFQELMVLLAVGLSVGVERAGSGNK